LLNRDNIDLFSPENNCRNPILTYSTLIQIYVPNKNTRRKKPILILNCILLLYPIKIENTKTIATKVVLLAVKLRTIKSRKVYISIIKFFFIKKAVLVYNKNSRQITAPTLGSDPTKKILGLVLVKM